MVIIAVPFVLCLVVQCSALCPIPCDEIVDMVLRKITVDNLENFFNAFEKYDNLIIVVLAVLVVLLIVTVCYHHFIVRKMLKTIIDLQTQRESLTDEVYSLKTAFNGQALVLCVLKRNFDSFVFKKENRIYPTINSVE